MVEKSKVEKVTPTLEAGERTATEVFNELAGADLVVPPYALSPSHAARLLAHVARVEGMGEDEFGQILGVAADLFEYMAAHCARPGRARDLEEQFTGDIEGMMNFVMAYVGALGESKRSSN